MYRSYANKIKREIIKKIVSDHFDAMIRSCQFEAEFNEIVSDYYEVKKYIGVRLYPSDYIAQVGKDLVLGKDFGGDIFAMLVFDLPDSVINIQPIQILGWGKTLDELFETGLQNIKYKYPLDIVKQDLGELKVWLIHSDHFFTPNIVFNLNNHQKLIGNYGALVGIPHRHAVLIYPIENFEVVDAINKLIPVVYGMETKGPGSDSNNIFLYQNGAFYNLPYKFEDNKIEFFPTEKLVALLEILKLNRD